MQTPIVRVFNKGGDILFYDENRFKEFVKNQTKSFKSKYYKGLGTTKTEDVPDTFGEKMVEYIEDEQTNQSINKVFHKDFADDRKKWLESFNPNPEFSLDDGGKMITMDMSSFLNNEVIKFSHDDCKRSIPSLFDGLKCLDPYTPVLLYNGNIKIAKDICIGDILVGDDGLPCNVINTCSGNDIMYKIKQYKGEDYIVNQNHILTLTFSGHKTIFWNKTTESWQIKWIDTKTYKIKSKNFGIRKSSIHKNSNKQVTRTKEDVYKDIEKFRDSILDNGVIDISISEYLKLSKTTKNHLCGFKSNGIYWDKKNIEIDPYILGSWLGDGTSNGKSICGEDIEVLNYWKEWCLINDCELIHKKKDLFYIRRSGNARNTNILPVGLSSIEKCKGCKQKKSIICANITELEEMLKTDANNNLIKNQILIRNKIDKNEKLSILSNGNKSKYGIPLNHLKQKLSKYNLIQNKHIPEDYLFNDRDTRLKLLAGLIDTDGCLKDNGHTVEIIQTEKREHMIDQIVLLCRSLGFSCFKHEKNVNYEYKGNKMIKKNFVVTFSGLNLNDIPTLILRKRCYPPLKRNVLNTMIDVVCIGNGTFNGFTVDNKTNRFLLGDFTVTHNCSQRKILFSLKKRNLTYNKQSVKVAQLGGYVAEHTNYHHGEQNLYETMVKMAHEFPGSNNIPLLYRDGQFGCLDPETDILMWNGTKKKAKDIQIGDRLIGDDGYPRNVRKITSGIDDMYNIIQSSGQTYKVNSQHILTLYCESHKNIWWSECSNSWNVSYYDKNERKLVDISIPVKIFNHTNGFTKEKGYKHISELIKDIPDDNNTFDIKVLDYIKMTPRMQSKFKGIFCNTHIKWKSSKTNIEPYELGILLRNRRSNMIPFSYIYNDINTRKKLLHGFLNSSSSIDTFKDSYEIDENYSCLFERIKIICNSLGFHTCKTPSSLIINTKPTYYTKIDVEYSGKGDFVGWSVDGNERFLLGDYTVTHNSRLSGGDDAASPRYIYTKMEPLTPLLFREEDDVLLEYVEDDGDKLEPTFYVPILPMILINGCAAIGTGWSSNIPCYNPHDIINCIKTWLDNDGKIFIEDDEDPSMIVSLLPSIIPWYRDFYGKIEEKDNKYITYGIISKEKNKTKITELPVGMWTDKFKEFCEDLLVDKQIKSLNNESTPRKVHFTLVEHDEGISCNYTNMKLTSTINISNMVAFNEKNQLKKYTVDEIINDFCIMRFEYYKKRKLYLINHCEKELRHLGNKARFIREVIDKKLNIMNIDEDIIITELENRKYDKEFRNDDDNDNNSTSTSSGYEYLLRMPVRVLSANQINKLKNDINSIQTKLDNIKSTSEKKMWLNDINEFEIEYEKWLKNMKNISDKTNKKKK